MRRDRSTAAAKAGNTVAANTHYGQQQLQTCHVIYLLGLTVSDGCLRTQVNASLVISPTDKGYCIDRLMQFAKIKVLSQRMGKCLG